MEPVADSILAFAIPGIETVPIIGIMRRLPVEPIVDIASAAAEAGIRALEVTLDSDQALTQISRIADSVPGISVGAGSVRRSEWVRRVADSGARFVVAPIVDEATIETTRELGLAALPGAATPTEIDRAVRLEATAVKVFPISQLGGVSYIDAIRSPLGNPPVVPTGGVTASTASAYLEAGAVAVGAGSDLFSPKAFAAGGVAEIGARAQAWVGGLQ